ncbi:hypothetical protein SAMN05421882_11211, partial [Nitrosomonas communis]
MKLLNISVISGAPFDKLNLVIDTFENAIGQTGLDKVNNPAPMRSDRVSKSLESWNAGLIDLIA